MQAKQATIAGLDAAQADALSDALLECGATSAACVNHQTPPSGTESLCSVHWPLMQSLDPWIDVTPSHEMLMAMMFISIRYRGRIKTIDLQA